MNAPEITRKQAWCKLAVLIADGLPAPRDVIFFPQSDMLDIVVDDAASLWAWAGAVGAEIEEPRWSEQAKRWYQKAIATWHGYYVTVKTFDASTRGEPVRSGMAAVRAIAAETSPAGRDPESPLRFQRSPRPASRGDQRAEAIAGFRELADFLDAHPEVPFDEYAPTLHLGVSNLPHMRGKDEPSILAELARIGDALGVEADLRDEPGAPHPHATKTFRGGVQYRALHVTEAYRRGYEAADETLLGVEEVAGPEVVPEPATAPAESERPVVLIASPVAGQPPSRAEIVADRGGTTVRVIYCESRTGARVARRRILGPAEQEG